MEDFGKYLYRLRARRGKYITQQKLSELTGYTQTYISLVETGKYTPSRRFNKAILMALGITNSRTKRYNAI